MPNLLPHHSSNSHYQRLDHIISNILKSVVLGYVMSVVGVYRNNKIGTKQGGKN